MKIRILLLLIIITILVLLCSCLNILNTSENFKLTGGKWKIESIGKINVDYIPSSYDFENLSFFGVATWVESEHKYFKFSENGRVFSNIMDTDLINKLNFSYIIDSSRKTIQFYGINPQDIEKGKQHLFSVEYNSISNNKMKWVIDDLLQVELIREGGNGSN